MLLGCIDGSCSKDRDGDMRGTSGTDGKMETEGDRAGWLEMNGTDDTNGSFETVGNADGVCRKRRLSRWGIVIRNGKTVGVAVGTNDRVGTVCPRDRFSFRFLVSSDALACPGPCKGNY